jgi:hypothetical protein
MAQSQTLSLQQVVATSGAIFSGKVIKVRSALDSTSGLLVTYTTVSVMNAVRGVNQGEFTFKQYGGNYGGLNVRVADMSYFSEGEEVVAFLYPASTLGLTSPVGISEGKLLIRSDPQTGKKFVHGNFFHAKMLESVAEKSAASQKTAAMPAPIIEYNQFMSLVRELARHHLQQ